jgi:tRNA-modifying protein YgfZ
VARNRVPRAGRGAPVTERRILEIAGADRERFLQGLISNDVRKAAGDGIFYAALLTPQGKYLADFFVVGRPEHLLIDVAAPLADGLARRLALYRLRADVTITPVPMAVVRGVGPQPAGALADPRDPALGWRLYGGSAAAEDIDWDAIRVRHLIPESGQELTPDIYILEFGFERLNGVDFRKGCYVGQEVTARMKHKTDLRKGLGRVRLDGPAGPGTPILTADGREAGVLHTRSGDQALAYLRFDRADGPMTAAGTRVTRDDLNLN